MTTTALQASLTVTVTTGGGPLDLTPYVLEASWSQGVSQRVGDASLTLTSLPTSVARWDEITITGGLVGRTISQRFGGHVQDFRHRHWPSGVSVKCVGYLGLAGRVRPGSDADAEAQDAMAAAGAFGSVTETVIDGVTYYVYTPAAVDTSTAAAYQARGVDLTNGHVGATDGAMVLQVLAACGLSSKCGQIGGTERVLGATAFEQFVWRRDQTALDLIAALDSVSLGHRTFDAPDGTIRRVLTGPRTPTATLAVALVEGTDILEGASLDDLAGSVANRVQVDGWNDGSGAKSAVATGVSPESLPSGLSYTTKKYDSRLIERGRLAETGTGLSCEEVALWHLHEDGTLWRRATLPTWRDDVVIPGEQISVTASHLGNGGGLSGVAWVESVRGSVSQSKVWRQDWTVVMRVGTATEALLGTLTMPKSLAVNP